MISVHRRSNEPNSLDRSAFRTTNPPPSSSEISGGHLGISSSLSKAARQIELELGLRRMSWKLWLVRLMWWVGSVTDGGRNWRRKRTSYKTSKGIVHITRKSQWDTVVFGRDRLYCGSGANVWNKITPNRVLFNTRWENQKLTPNWDCHQS